MTDRDHFAAAALTGLLSQWKVTPGNQSPEMAALTVVSAYQLADDMLRERERTNHDAAPERGDALAYDEAAARLLYERDSANDELSLLRRAVRQLLDGVNERHPEKPPREWVCNDMALLDRLVPPNHDASPEAIAGTPGTGDTQSFDAYRRFVGEVMNWISEATGFLHDDVLRTDDARDVIHNACMRCWDAFDRIAYPTDHGASPEARASVDSVAPQPTTRGESDRTDKAAPRPSEGTGDTPDSPKPIKGGVSDRSKPITGPDPDSRVWETHTPATHATRGEGSERRECTEPAAWYVRDRAAGPPMLFWDEERAKKAAFACGVGARPLYLCQDLSQKHLTLTDAEAETLRELRDEAAQYADEIGLCASEVRGRQRIIDGLLERMGGGR